MREKVSVIFKELAGDRSKDLERHPFPDRAPNKDYRTLLSAECADEEKFLCEEIAFHLNCRLAF